MKDQDADSLDANGNSPYLNLLSRILNKDLAKPRRKTAVNVWRKTQRHEIETRVKKVAAAAGTSKDHLAALRDRVARDMFNALSPAVQEKWKKQADKESSSALAEWQRNIKEEPSVAAADRQR